MVSVIFVQISVSTNGKRREKKNIVQCAVNTRQVVIGLTGGELVYFELDNTGNLMDIHRKELRNEIACLAIGPVPEGRQRSAYMVVGSYESNVRVLSLDPQTPMHQLTLQALPAQPESLALVNMSGIGKSETPDLYLYVGLQNGVMIRSLVDDAHGKLSDTRKRFLGTRPVKLFEVQIYGKPAVLALSTRSWLSYTYQGRHHMTPLSYEVLEYCSSFTSEQCPEGVVCIAENTLRIVTLERLGELFNQTVVPLRYTPRKLLVHEESSHLIIAETDHNAYSYKVKKELQATLQMDDDDDEDGPKDDEDSGGPPEDFVGSPQAGINKWASCLRIVDPVQGETSFLLELEDNQAVFSMCIVKFAKEDGLNGMTESYLAVGVAKEYQITPPKCSSASIQLYRFGTNSDGSPQLELMHETPVDQPPLAMTMYQKQLLVGMGPYLRLYALGKRKLLRKCESKCVPTAVKALHVMADRIWVGDMCESWFLVKHDKTEKTLNVVADTNQPRYITASCVVDYDTVAAGDKFGNIFVTRVPADVREELENDPMAGAEKLLGRYGDVLNGSDYKMKDIVNMHIGEIVTSITKASLVTGGTDVLFYSTLMGGLGILVPLTNKEDIDFFNHLEMHLRQEAPPLCGRDHLAYRSYYFPVKDCIDGDLCEMFSTLDWSRQQAVGEELVRVPAEVSKKLEEIRNRVL